jgi:hypothetical protein
MSRTVHVFLVAVVLAGGVAGQVVYIDNNNPATGTSNTIPWNQSGGYSSLHVYNAAQLTAGGVCGGALLTDVAVAPSSTTTGVYSAPQARLTIGHLTTDPPVLGGWESNFSTSVIVHDLTSGPYTFPYVLHAWTSLPGVQAAGFVWDGVSSIAIYYTTAAGVTGGFSAHRTSTNMRHVLGVFNATNQLPSSTGLAAMKVALTFTPGPTYQVNQPGASLTIDGLATTQCLPLSAIRAVGQTSTLTIASTLVGSGWEIVFTAPEPMVASGAGAMVLPNSGQLVNIDLSAPSLGFLNSLTFPPFPGTFFIGVTLPFPFAFTAQLGVLDPGNPDGVLLSGAVRLVVQ